MKKICFITTIPLTLRVFVLNMAMYLHDNTDWDISFICDYDEEFAKELPDYIHYYPVRMRRGISISGINAMIEIKKIFEREKFDLIQYSTPNASLYASLAGWLANIPVRLYCQWGMVYVEFTGLKRCFFKKLEKLICKLSTWIEPDSNSNLNFAHAEKLYPKNKGSVIWNGSACGVNLEKFNFQNKKEYRKSVRQALGLNESQFVFGFVGRITKDKGINELLTAFIRLIENHRDVYLVMVGPIENSSLMEKELFDWARKSDRVIFVGYTDTVERYLSAMDVYVLPSYREGFGMGIVEAEAMGVPVIVTDIPGPIDAMIDGKTGIKVEKKNKEMLFEAMEELYNDRLKVDYYGENARSYVVDMFEQRKLFEHILSDRIKLLQ